MSWFPTFIPQGVIADNNATFYLEFHFKNLKDIEENEHNKKQRQEPSTLATKKVSVFDKKLKVQACVTLVVRPEQKPQFKRTKDGIHTLMTDT